jgi:hypothetical protein
VRIHAAFCRLPHCAALAAVTASCSDPAVSAAETETAIAIQAATWNARQTEIYTRIPTRTPTPSRTPRPYVERRIAPVLCAPVAEGGTIIQALTDANRGTFPERTDMDGYPYSVLVDHQDPATLANIRYIMTLNKILTAPPVVSSGDLVCSRRTRRNSQHIRLRLRDRLASLNNTRRVRLRQPSTGPPSWGTRG